MKKTTIAELMVTLMLMVLLYAAFSKYFDFAGFQRAMHNQPFPSWLSSMVIILLPPVEILAAVLLLIPSTRITGLKASMGLMSGFTMYILAIILHLFPKVPCSCGGLIRQLTWGQHLLFNLVFIAISVIALRILNNDLKVTTAQR